MDIWKGKIAVVTGASSGIGRAIALELAENGMKVIAIARREKKLQELAKSNGKIIPQIGDITDDAVVEKIFQWIEDNHGPVSVLINSAGIMYKSSILNGEDMSKIKYMFDVNVLALIKCSQCAYKTMSTLDRGHIININSIAGHDILNFDHLGAYSATKHAVTVLSKALVRDIAYKKLDIRVTSLSPGLVKTELLQAGQWEVDYYGILSSLEVSSVAQAALVALTVSTNAVRSSSYDWYGHMDGETGSSLVKYLQVKNHRRFPDIDLYFISTSHKTISIN